MICKKCGNEIDDNLNYCNKCGALANDKNPYVGIGIFLVIITAIMFIVGLNGAQNGEWYGWLSLNSILAMVFGVACNEIGDSKGIYCGFVLGWFLGIIGLAIVAAQYCGFSGLSFPILSASTRANTVASVRSR